MSEKSYWTITGGTPPSAPTSCSEVWLHRDQHRSLRTHALTHGFAAHVWSWSRTAFLPLVSRAASRWRVSAWETPWGWARDAAVVLAASPPPADGASPPEMPSPPATLSSCQSTRVQTHSGAASGHTVHRWTRPSGVPAEVLSASPETAGQGLIRVPGHPRPAAPHRQASPSALMLLPLRALGLRCCEVSGEGLQAEVCGHAPGRGDRHSRRQAACEQSACYPGPSGQVHKPAAVTTITLLQASQPPSQPGSVGHVHCG